MKKTLIPLLLLTLISILFITNCKKDKSTDTPQSPLGSWVRTYSTTETYSAQLNLTESGKFEWIILDTLSTHSNSFAKIAITGNQLRIYNDPDFAGDGIYTWEITGGELLLTLVSDNYPARVNAMAGSWTAKNAADFSEIIGSWDKTMTVQGNPYQVRLSMNALGDLAWEMIDSIPGHTNSLVTYVATDNTIVIYKDKDCNGNGFYNYTVNGSSLHISMLKDDCPVRSPSFSGTWTKQ